MFLDFIESFVPVPYKTYTNKRKFLILFPILNLSSYCAREDVKPLSTADFGKVMKQIFPSIRPRRLGTRGNSRYCYAAMRKTTKLECPQLPSLGDTLEDSSIDPTTSNLDSSSNSAIGSAATWKVIQTWAESLLNTDFKNPHDLAEHISNNYMSGTSGTISNNSRALLQKKLLQRKVKGRKKKCMSMSEVSIYFFFSLTTFQCWSFS